MGRAGERAAAEERAVAPGRGDCSEGSIEVDAAVERLPLLPTALLLKEELDAFKAAELVLTSLYNAKFGRNGLYCEFPASKLEVPSCCVA